MGWRPLMPMGMLLRLRSLRLRSLRLRSLPIHRDRFLNCPSHCPNHIPLFPLATMTQLGPTAPMVQPPSENWLMPSSPKGVLASGSAVPHRCVPAGPDTGHGHGVTVASPPAIRSSSSPPASHPVDAGRAPLNMLHGEGRSRWLRFIVG